MILNTKYTGPKASSVVSDEDVKNAWQACEFVVLFARNCNILHLRKIAFGEFPWSFLLTRAFPIIGIDPEKLRPIYALFAKNPLPETIQNYEQLDKIGFPFNRKCFLELAKILGKSVHIFHEDPNWVEDDYWYTAYPSGELTGPGA